MKLLEIDDSLINLESVNLVEKLFNYKRVDYYHCISFSFGHSRKSIVFRNKNDRDKVFDLVLEFLKSEDDFCSIITKGQVSNENKRNTENT